MTLTEFFENVYKPLRLRGKSPNTYRLYGCLIRVFSRWLGRDATIADLEELVFARYLNDRANEVSPYTVERERCGLVALAGLAAERRLIEMKPTCPPGPMPERVPQAWSVDEMRQLMAAASDPKTYKVKAAFFTAFFPALISVCWDTGERIGAVLDARQEDYRRPSLLVRAEARKGRKRDRLYKLADATCDRIEAAMVPGRSHIFFWPYSQTYLYNRFGKVIATAGLHDPTRRRLRFHQIRRSALSHFAAAGGDPVAMADHSSPKITQRWYLDPRLTDRGVRPCDVLPSIGCGEQVDVDQAANLAAG